MTVPKDGNGPYSIGSNNWNGLSKLIEECGEVTQVCGKIIGTGGELQHWDGTDLKVRLEEELADLCAAMSFIIETNNLSMSFIVSRKFNKVKLFNEWNNGTTGL